MAQIVDVELVGLEEGEGQDAFLVTFDVIYPGETWCRSLVRVTPQAASSLETVTAEAPPAAEHRVIARARDCLLSLLELESGPSSAEIRLTGEGLVVLALGRPNLR